MNFALMFHALLGTALVAAGAAALNQLLEREYDAKMRRTASRPLPSGRLQPTTVMLFGGVCSVAGLIYLALLVNLLTSVIGAVTLVSYLFIYTPLKRVTWMNTLVGAVPGALPPLMGWTAARGELSGEGWTLFAILAFWQIPHFMAIAWIYRDEYARAGFKMLPNVDPSGRRTGEQAVSHTLALFLVGLCPFLFKMAGPVYLAAALVLGAGYFWCAHSIFAAAHGGARAAIVSGVHHLSAAAAGGDGLGQGEINLYGRQRSPISAVSRGRGASWPRRPRPSRTSRAGVLEQIHFLHRPQGHRHPIRLHGAVLHAVRIFPDAADALADCASGPCRCRSSARCWKNSSASRRRAARFRPTFTIPSARCTGRSWCFSAWCRWRSRRSAITSCR